MKFQGTPKKPMKIGSVETVDMESGQTISQRENAMTLMPPPEGTCPECAVDHPHDQPHNQQSLYYQYHFYATHGRWPTWSDAMAHCADEAKAQWRALLIEEMGKQGIEVPEDLKSPATPGR